MSLFSILTSYLLGHFLEEQPAELEYRENLTISYIVHASSVAAVAEGGKNVAMEAREESRVTCKKYLRIKSLEEKHVGHFCQT